MLTVDMERSTNMQSVLLTHSNDPDLSIILNNVFPYLDAANET